MTKARMRSSTKRLLWVLAFVALMALLHRLWGWSVFASILENQSVTAWVQGLGSVAAVFVAIRLASEQRRREQEVDAMNAFEARRAMTFTILHSVEAAERTLRYLFLDFSVHVGQARPKRTERLEDLQQTFEVLLAKSIPDDLLPHVLAVKRELAYGLMALRSHQNTKIVTPKRVRGARTRYHRVRDKTSEIRRHLENLGYVFEGPSFARTGAQSPAETLGEAGDLSVQFPLPSDSDFSVDIPREVEMTEED